MTKEQIIHWLLEGDVSIQYQTYRDLLDQDKPRLRNKINSEGWGLKFLSKRHKNAYWGQSFYQPKWISTLHLIGFKNLNISSTNKLIKESVQKYLIQKKDLMEEYALSDKIKSAMFASMAWYWIIPPILELKKNFFVRW